MYYCSSSSEWIVLYLKPSTLRVEAKAYVLIPFQTRPDSKMCKFACFRRQSSLSRMSHKEFTKEY